MRGTAEKAWQKGFHVVRLNQRNCGGTEAFTPTLYNSGLSADVGRVVDLLDREGRGGLCLGGFSMGGNLVLKLAGERGAELGVKVIAVVAVSPSIDLAACAQALEAPANWIYQWEFVRSLKRRLRKKAKLFPDRFDLSALRPIRTVCQFDEAYTAPDGGYASAEDYYERASALRVLAGITVPTLILHAQNDPLIPFESFSSPALTRNPQIHLVAPAQGGHCAFLARPGRGESSHWAEHRLVEFCARASGLADPD
jgi:hypothetical protein